MDAVQDRASLHEKAVQAVAKGEVERPKRKRRSPVRKSSKVKHTVLDERIQKWMRQHRIDLRDDHVQILGPSEAIIWNKGAPIPTRAQEVTDTKEKEHDDSAG